MRRGERPRRGCDVPTVRPTRLRRQAPGQAAPPTRASPRGVRLQDAASLASAHHEAGGPQRAQVVGGGRSTEPGGPSCLGGRAGPVEGDEDPGTTAPEQPAERRHRVDVSRRPRLTQSVDGVEDRRLQRLLGDHGAPRHRHDRGGEHEARTCAVENLLEARQCDLERIAAPPDQLVERADHLLDPARGHAPHPQVDVGPHESVELGPPLRHDLVPHRLPRVGDASARLAGAFGESLDEGPTRALGPQDDLPEVELDLLERHLAQPFDLLGRAQVPRGRSRQEVGVVPLRPHEVGEQTEVRVLDPHVRPTQPAPLQRVRAGIQDRAHRMGQLVSGGDAEADLGDVGAPEAEHDLSIHVETLLGARCGGARSWHQLEPPEGTLS